MLSGKHVQGSIITDFLALQAPLKGKRLSGEMLFLKRFLVFTGQQKKKCNFRSLSALFFKKYH